MKAEDKKRFLEEAELEESAYDSSASSIDKDYETLQQTHQIGEFVPDDIFKYKYLRLVPKAQEEYSGIVDKDSVLANIKGTKPDIEEISFVNQTIMLIKRVFLVEKEFVMTDSENNPIYENGKPKTIVMNVFDSKFQSIIDDSLNIIVKSLLFGLITFV